MNTPTITVSLSGTSITAYGWDGGAQLNGNNDPFDEIKTAFNNGKVIKAGRGFRVEFQLTIPQAKELLRDLRDYIEIYAPGFVDPEAYRDRYAWQRDADRIQKQLEA